MNAPDPILAAIAAHRVAIAVLEAAPIKDDNAADRCIDIEGVMLETVPTTQAGLRALVEYAGERRDLGDSQIPVEYFPAILVACRAVLP